MSRSAVAARRRARSPARWSRRMARTISSRQRSNTPRNKSSRRHDCVGFDLDEYLWCNEPADFDHAGRRPNVLEELAVGLADLFPAGNVGHEHARPHNVAHGRAQADERGLDILEALHSLGISIAHAYDV